MLHLRNIRTVWLYFKIDIKQFVNGWTIVFLWSYHHHSFIFHLFLTILLRNPIHSKKQFRKQSNRTESVFFRKNFVKTLKNDGYNWPHTEKHKKNPHTHEFCLTFLIRLRQNIVEWYMSSQVIDEYYFWRFQKQEFSW